MSVIKFPLSHLLAPGPRQVNLNFTTVTSCVKQKDYLGTSTIGWAVRIAWVSVCKSVCGMYVSPASLVITLRHFTNV